LSYTLGCLNHILRLNLVVTTGLRPGELLRREDTDLEDETMRVARTLSAVGSGSKTLTGQSVEVPSIGDGE
jgi:hypothetical protein